MRFVLLMIVLSAGILLALVARSALTGLSRPAQQPLNPETESSQSSHTSDELALARIKREHATARFPFLVSSLCRDFLQRFASSPHRAEVEQILKRNQEEISKEALVDSAGKSDRSLIKREDVIPKKPATDRQGP
jgi:hypothetical protein